MAPPSKFSTGHTGTVFFILTSSLLLPPSLEISYVFVTLKTNSTVSSDPGLPW